MALTADDVSITAYASRQLRIAVRPYSVIVTPLREEIAGQTQNSLMLPQSLPASLDWRVLAFAVALSAVVGLLIGLVPEFHILRTNLAAVLQSSPRGASSSRGVRALSGVLVVAQVAVA